MGYAKPSGREHPGNFHLTPDTKRAIAAQIKGRKKVTSLAVRHLAAHHHCAIKTVLMTAQELGVDVIADPPELRTVEKTNQQKKFERAENFFATPLVIEDVKEDERNEAPVLEAEAIQMLLEMEERMIREQSEALDLLSTMEKQMIAATNEAANERARAEAAIQQTADFRRSTRKERDQYELILGEVGVARRKCAAMTKEVEWMNKALIESIRREKDMLSFIQSLDIDTIALRKRLDECSSDLAKVEGIEPP